MGLQKYHAHGETRETTENGAVRIPRAMSRTFRKGLSSGQGCFYGKRYAYELVSMTVRELF